MQSAVTPELEFQSMKAFDDDPANMAPTANDKSPGRTDAYQANIMPMFHEPDSFISNCNNAN